MPLLERKICISANVSANLKRRMKDSSAQQQWLQTRKRLLSQIKAQVGLRLGAEALFIPGYTSFYRREFKRPWKKSSNKELLKAVLHSQIVLGADFHAFSQSQRIHLRILRDIPKSKRLVLALECFESRHQKWLDLWMAHKCGEQQLLEAVRWNESWGFPFDHYLPLLELARERQWPLLALNQNLLRRNLSTLTQRDQHAAELMVQVWDQKKPDLVYAIFGDLHLAEPHLPRAIRRQPGGRDLKLTTVFQNAEELYFSVVKKGLEQSVDVMRAEAGKFCVLGSPPWVKWQSYLMYLEEAYDQDLDHDGLDIQDQFHSWLQFFIRDLKLSVTPPEIALFSSQDSTLGKQLKKNLSEKHRRLAEKLIASDRSFFIPQKGPAYLSRYSLNHAATLAGYALHAQLSDRKRLMWDFPKDFRRSIWLECVGFFFSKLMNHKRKPENLLDVSLKFRQAMGLAVHERMRQLAELNGKIVKAKNIRANAFVYLEAARILGTHLGEELYVSYRQNQISLNQLKKWLEVDVANKDFDADFLAMLTQFSSTRFK